MWRRAESRSTRSRRVRSCGKAEAGTAAGRPILKASASSSVRRCRSGDLEPLMRSRASWRMCARARRASSPAHVLQLMADRVARTSSSMQVNALVSLLLLLAACSQQATPQATRTTGPQTITGSIGSAAYDIQVPERWNGTLFLYSHGYVAPGGSNRAQAAPTADARTWLLGQRYAIAGSAYSSTGWALEDAFKDQIALLDFFARRLGKPQRVIAWGTSLGGIVTAGLVQLHP